MDSPTRSPVVSNKPFKRRKKLIDPKLQLRFACIFAGLAGVSVICQSLITTYLLTGLVNDLPNDQGFALAQLPKIVSIGIIGSTLLMLPLCAALGVITTFPIVGPLYRFRVFLRSVIDGAEAEPCKIRKSDELQDVCALLNEATTAVRLRNAAAAKRKEGRRQAA